MSVQVKGSGTIGGIDEGLNVVGVVTATSFSGSGANLTNINSTGATGDFSIVDKIIHDGDTNTAIRFPSADTFTVETSGDERIRIKSDGKIEVPTTGKLSLGMNSPVAQFTAGTANGSRVIEIQGTDGVIRGYNRNGNAWAQIDFEASDYTFDCGGSEKLRIGSSGQIGIGGANYGSSGQVLTSQGASSAVAWASLAVGKFASYAVVADANNTGNQNAGDFSSGAWRTRILDTEIADSDGIVSLSSNRFTLQAGNYFIVAWASALQVNGHQARLRDITNGATRAHGSSEYTGNGDYVTTKSWIYTRVTPSSATAYELQHRCQTSSSNVGFGNGSGDQWTQEANGDTYCMVIIFKEV